MSDQPERRPAGPPRPDETTPMPPVDPASVRPPVAAGGADETRPMAPVAKDATAADDPAWTGRARVRPAQPQAEYTEVSWAPEVSEPTGRWWMPIVVGTVALILLSLLG